MSRDPFRPPARHAGPPRRTVRKILLTAAGSAVLLGAGMLAAPHVHAATRTDLGAVVAQAAESAVQRITPRPAPLIPAGGSRLADRRVCRALAVFDAAGLPSDATLRNLAAAGMGATRAYRDAAGQLIMAVVAGQHGYAADTRLQRLCGTD